MHCPHCWRRGASGAYWSTAAESYEQTDDAHYRIRPDRPEDIQSAPRGGAATRSTALSWHRPSLEFRCRLSGGDDRGFAGDRPRLWVAAAPCCWRKSWRAWNRLTRLGLWLITQGAQAAGDKLSPLSIAQSPLWGLGRVIAQEHPTFWGGLVDLEPAPSARDGAAEQLWDEIAAGDGEDQLAFRQGRRYVGRLVRWRPSAKEVSSPPLADRRQLSDQRWAGRSRAPGGALDGRARGATFDPSGAHRAPATLEAGVRSKRGVAWPVRSPPFANWNLRAPPCIWPRSMWRMKRSCAGFSTRSLRRAGRRSGAWCMRPACCRTGSWHNWIRRR